ncbi:MAG: methyltransferase domain-containing protein [Candidatus Thorarchaeota archaeon]|nr:methyltransferase domain-containing protein [Candidatus Thorarchaeota archaeon]
MNDERAHEWDDNAEAYASLIDQRGTPHHRAILNPCVERLLGDIKGKTLLDAGCGEGYLSRHYARIGALVTGVDISSRLVRESSDLATREGLNIAFIQGDICHMRQLPNGTFDAVLCNLVLLNVPCIDAALLEFNRVLRPGGVLVFSVVHPAFDVYGPGHWEMGEKSPNSGRRRGLWFVMDNYFSETEYKRVWKTRDGRDFPVPITFYHRTLSTYISSVRKAGLLIDAVEEPLPPSDDDFFERERRIPFFLVIRAIKPAC